ncbi:MAG: NAD(+)/NADH kinase [Oscillospiraceae bacterium]|nr:NAD(+)/NADH kinase [Oscillospiraceae bacterium]
MKRVILCPNPYRDKGLAAAKEANALLREVGLTAVYCLPFRPEGGDAQFGVPLRPLQQELRTSDLVVAFGGDGTILHLARAASQRGVPVLGVNLGSLGFMSDLEAGELALLKNLASGRYRREKRMMLDVSVLREGRTVYTGSALNDAVITKGAMARVVRLQISAGEEQLGLFSGDGVVVATPTGSTGYSLSAGGPIVEPTAQNFVISPICAHTVFSKSFVLSAAGTVTVAPAELNRKQVYLSVDGGKAFALRQGDKVRICRSRYETELLRLTDRTIYEILRTKMTGGIGHEK